MQRDIPKIHWKVIYEVSSKVCLIIDTLNYFLSKNQHIIDDSHILFNVTLLNIMINVMFIWVI